MKGILIKDLKKLDDIVIETPILIPDPKEINGLDRNNAFLLNSECSICTIDVDNQKVIHDDINDFLAQTSGVKLKKFNPDINDIQVLENRTKWDVLDINNEDGYNLEISGNRVLIYSIFEKGVFYGLQTLIQLLKNSLLTNKNILSAKKESRDRFILPEVQIKDVPDLKIRGVAQDVSRGQIFTVENVKRYLDILSHYKMNFYCPYMEDMYAHPKHPEIGKNRGALTVKEVKEIDEYAKSRYIEFVPIFECLGHVDNILTHKKYQHLGEFPGAQCLDISNPDIYPFLTDYISDLSKNFSTEYFHLGLDESFDLGKYNSKEYIKEKGKCEAITEFYEKLYDITKENNNRHIMMYDDIVRTNKKIFKDLNKDMIMMYWYYGKKKKDKTINRFIKEGYRVIASPSMLSWERNYPDSDLSARNIMNFINAAYKFRNHGCLGVLTSTWGDQRYYSFRENEIFGAILTGDMAWTTPNFKYHEFKSKYGFLFYGINKEKLDDFNELFTKLSSSTSYLYNFIHKFIKLLPPLFFTYLFKHPFNRQKYKIPFKKYIKLGVLANKCLKMYDALLPDVLFEKENFELIQYAAELAKFLYDKIELSVKTSKLLLKPEISPREIENILKDLEQFRDLTKILKGRYEVLWLRAAKKPCLDVILKLFDSLIKAYDDKIKEINDKVYFKNPYLESEWIGTGEKKCPPDPRYFRHTFEVKQGVKKAIIQGIANTHMKVYVNNEYVGEVMSRLSLSIRVITQRVQTFDITKLLKEGNNIIAIEAYTYEGYKGAINLFGQIQLKDDSIQEILSNVTWKCYKKDVFENDEWKGPEFNDALWKNAKSHGRPPKLNGDIMKPELLNGEISNTQDYFGGQGYFYNLLDTFVGGFLKTLARPLIPTGIKILKPYG